MEDNKKTFGDALINGRIVNLDTASIAELEEYVQEIKKSEQDATITLNKIIEEIENS